MKLFQASPRYNPYYITIGNNTYRISSINVFDKSGIVARNSSGWFGSNNNVPSREFPCDCVRKLKEDFSCKTAFVLKDDGIIWETQYVLYIPESILKLEEPVMRKYLNQNLCITKRSSIYRDVYFEEFFFLDRNLYKIRKEYKEICKEIEANLLHPEKLIDQANCLLKKVKEYVKEDKRLTALTVEEAIEEMEKIKNTKE